MKIISMHILKYNNGSPLFVTSSYELGFL